MEQAIRVLIVDDEDDFRETLVKRLKARHFAAEGASGGDRALALLETQTFDVIVLDVKMPGLDGIETLRRVKQQHPETAVIMLTGHASVEFGLQGMQLGAFDYMMKPAPIDALVDTIGQAFRKKSDAPV